MCPWERGGLGRFKRMCLYGTKKMFLPFVHFCCCYFLSHRLFLEKMLHWTTFSSMMVWKVMEQLTASTDFTAVLHSYVLPSETDTWCWIPAPLWNELLEPVVVPLRQITDRHCHKGLSICLKVNSSFNKRLNARDKYNMENPEMRSKTLISEDLSFVCNFAIE